MRGQRLMVPGFGNKVMAFLPRVMPRGMLLSLTGMRQRRRTIRSAPRT
jgi:hypothetical protein